jgi:hypothetical protein
LAIIFAQVLATFACQIFVKINFSKKISRPIMLNKMFYDL